MRPAPAIAAIRLVFAWCAPGHAAGVFLPVGTAVPASQTAQPTVGDVGQSRVARIAPNELQRTPAEVGNFGRGHLLFNMGERVELDVAIQHTARTVDGYTLSGHIDGGRGRLRHARGIPAGGGRLHLYLGGGLRDRARRRRRPAVRRVMDEPLECGGVAQAPSVEPPHPPQRAAQGKRQRMWTFWTPALESPEGHLANLSTATRPD